MSISAIHIALGFSDPQGNYASHAGATLASVFANTRHAVCAHIFHDKTLTEENRANLTKTGNDFGQTVCFHPAHDDSPEENRFTPETTGKVYRLLLPELLPVEKVIYLDCDVIVHLDIEELWRIPITDYPIAAVHDQGIPYWPGDVKASVRSCQIDLDDYFNSGMLIMNLQCIKPRWNLFDEWTNFIQQYPRTRFMDQNVLNKLFQKNCRWLEPKYNRLAGHHHCPIEALEETKAIWHFSGHKPWKRYVSAVDLLYWRYLVLTPWGKNAAEEIFRLLSTEIKEREQAGTSEIRQIQNSRSWRLTRPLRWIAAQFRSVLTRP